MIVNTSDIKNLSIALEALSRIPKVEDLSTRIESLLTRAIKKVEDLQVQQPVHSRPPALIDDEIPF